MLTYSQISGLKNMFAHRISYRLYSIGASLYDIRKLSSKYVWQKKYGTYSANFFKITEEL